jgi:sugar lactone lactonase YvrE
MTRRVLVFAALTTAALACDAPRPPARQPAHTPSAAPSQRAFTLPERDLLPESIAFDPATGSFYVGSMHRRKIVRRERDGRVTDWAGPERGLWSIIGIKLDPSARELWANSCNLGDDLPMTPADSTTLGRGALVRLRLDDGSVVRRYEPPPSARPICFNDLALSPQGDVFLTAGRTGLWRLPRGGASLERVLRDSTLWLNGVATGPDGALYAADDSLGPLLVDPATGRWRRVAAPPGDTLRGIDGLYVHRGALLWVQNGVEPARVVQAPLSAGGAAVERLRVLEAGHPDYLSPTTGVVVGDTLFYVATAQLRAIRPGGRLAPLDSMRDNIILRLPIPPPLP